jgi:hypothetical protein
MNSYLPNEERGQKRDSLDDDRAVGAVASSDETKNQSGSCSKAQMRYAQNNFSCRTPYMS